MASSRSSASGETRGAAKSYCILITGPRVSPLAEERLNAMVRTQDGFELAELDLSMRGPGEFFGTRQAGLPDFRVANLLAIANSSNWPKSKPPVSSTRMPKRAGELKALKPNAPASGPA